MLPFVYTPRYVVDIGPHVFPTVKYRLVADQVSREGLVAPEAVEDPPDPPEADLLLVHEPEYLDDFRNCRWTTRTSRSELPLTPEIAAMYRLAAGGTTLAARRALEFGGAYHCGGGFHHAFADHAEGFCYLNDIAIALRVLLRDGLIRRPIVVDCDLHQGNGTARIFRDAPEVFTFSIHEENNYPVKERSDLDIGLDSFTDDRTYLAALGRVVPDLYVRHRADFLLYVAGADPFEQDQLGSLRLSMDGLQRRDDLVLGAAANMRIPFAVVPAGGYARDLADTVAIHVSTVKAAREALARRGPEAPPASK